MPILDIQKRARELGRIRTGQKGPKGQPQKLDRFRLTSASRPLLEKVAELYGGEVREWEPAGGAKQWEVITDATRLPIMVPPQPVSQWYEAWTAGGCVHRCDGETDFITGEACDNESKLHQDSKPTTRLNVVLRDVEGIGVWRLESHGWNAAVELPQAAEFLAQAGGYVNGWVGLEERVSKSEGQTRRYMVPIIEIDVTPSELMAGKGSIAAPSVEGPVARAALESGRPDYPALLDAARTPEEVNAIWFQAKEAGHLDQELADRIKAAADALKALPAGSDVEEVEAELVDDDTDPAPIWQACVAKGGDLGLGLWDLESELKAFANVTVAEATVQMLQAFLEDLGKREPVNA